MKISRVSVGIGFIVIVLVGCLAILFATFPDKAVFVFELVGVIISGYYLDIWLKKLTDRIQKRRDKKNPLLN